MIYMYIRKTTAPATVRYPGKLFFHIYDIYQFAGRGAAFVVVALFLLRVQYRTWYEYMVSYTYMMIHDSYTVYHDDVVSFFY